jgi:hypothetical protein
MFGVKQILKGVRRMGYAFMTGNCWVCRKLFTFNPVRVPSIRDGSGVRQPICRNCIEMANRVRVIKGMEPFPVPGDAYEACDEAEL